MSTTRRNILLACLLGAAIALPLVAQETPAFRAGTPPSAAPRSQMSIPQAIILGIVEGLTEYLPVSSTGHLNVVQSLLGLWATPEEKNASDAYAICIQAGAIIAVFLIFFGRIKGMVRGIFGQDQEGLRLAGNVVVAFIPAAMIGLMLEKTIKQYLYGIWPVGRGVACRRHLHSPGSRTHAGAAGRRASKGSRGGPRSSSGWRRFCRCGRESAGAS